MSHIKIVVEQHSDGFTGYPLGFARGAIVGYGETLEDAVRDTESAVAMFIQHFGIERFLSHIETESPLENAYIAEVGVAA